jgi:hypothetical protein
MNIQTIIASILLTIIAGLGLMCWHYSSENDKLLQQVATYKAAVKQLEDTAKIKDAAIAEQNSKLDEVNALAAARQKKAAEAVEAARIAGESNVKMSNFLLLAKPKSDDLCKEAEGLINLLIEKEMAK